MEGRVVVAEHSSVSSGVVLVLLLDASGIPVLYDSDCQGVPAWSGCLADVETSSCEGPVNPSEVLPVQIDFRLPVDSVELKPCLPVHKALYDLELVPVPEVRPEI